MARPGKRMVSSDGSTTLTLRSKLLELATEDFARRGYVAASLRDIAEQAGVTVAALYYHFEKKEDLLRDIVLGGLDQIAQAVTAASTESGTPEQALEAVIRAHLDYNARYPEQAKIIIEESRFLNDADLLAVREKQTAVLDVYRRCVRELRDAGRVGDIDPTITAFNAISVVVGWYRWFRTSGPVPKRDAFDYTVQFALAAVLNAKPGESRP